jgi:DNA-binding response OmpR family regulator
MMRVLVIEDGFEYSETLGQFLPDGFQWERSGSGPQGLARLSAESFEVIFLDMRFDRAPSDELYGNVEEVADRFNGDPVQARRFLEDHQGNYILSAIRDAGISTPVLMSYDFDTEPRRWKRLVERYGPVDYLPDNASPAEIAARLTGLSTG